VIPAEYRDWVYSRVPVEGRFPLPDWTAADAIAVMDDNGVSTGLLSLCVPGTYLGDGADAPEVARRVNEFSAEVVKDRPDRFGFFATLTLPNVDAAVAEAAYALDELTADGIALFANHEGRYLGDPAFDPLLDELNRRGTVVHVHPTLLPGPTVPELGPAVADFLLDTTRAAINLVRVGAVRRYPDVKFILSHAGGFMPYASHRIAGWLAAFGATDTPLRHDLPDVDRRATDALARMPRALDELASFYFDVALSSSPATLPTLLAFAKPGHVLFGSDWPFARDSAVRSYADSLDAYPGLTAEQHAAINRGNAEALFPRLA
jgi:predicted TIM-barrel fold metal-dependent hydrolase